MAKFFGAIGFAENQETVPGVWEDVIVERKYYGDILRISRKLTDPAEKLNNDISVGNSFSIMADAYAYNNFFAMRYIRWSGAVWIVSDVEVVAPRLNLRVGGVYNGPQAPAPDTP